MMLKRARGDALSRQAQADILVVDPHCRHRRKNRDIGAGPAVLLDLVVRVEEFAFVGCRVRKKAQSDERETRDGHR
jgi:hypothetical protein